jgi:hypothetical protein
MKKINFKIHLLLASVVLSQSIAIAQCNMRWGSTQKVYGVSFGEVFIKIQSSNCTSNGGICGWPKIAITHTFKETDVTVSVYLKGIDCENIARTSGFHSNHKAANVEVIETGNWHVFKRVDDAVRITVQFKKGNDLYECILDKEKNINKVLKNGSKLLSNGKTEKEMEKESLAGQQKKGTSGQKNTEGITASTTGVIITDTENEKTSTKDNENETNKPESKKSNTTQSEEEKLAQLKAEATRKEDSIKRAERDTRVNNFKENQAVNETIATGLALTTTALILDDDLQDSEISNQFVGIRFGLGVGMENIPAITNHYSGNGTTSNSSMQTSALPFASTALIHASFINSEWFRIFVQPEGQFGVTFATGSLGSYSSYGGKAGFSIGKKLRIHGEFGYFNRTFTEQYDHDAANESIGIYTYTNDQSFTDFSYWVKRISGGLQLRFNESYTPENQIPKVGFIQLSAFFDQPDYYFAESLFELPGVELTYKAPGGFFLKGLYAPKYPFAGNAKYHITDAQENGTYFSVTIGKIFGTKK